MTTSTDAVAALLVGAGFGGFTFHTGFCLRFGTRRGGEVFVELNGDWRMGDAETWAAMVQACPLEGVEPEEPMQAAALAHLRWSRDSRIVSADVRGGDLRIEFADGGTLTALASDPPQSGPDWRVHEGDRAVTSDGGFVDVVGFDAPP